jgi:dihydrofolate reductase
MTTLYSASMSLDGFIAGPGGDMSWLSSHLSEPNPTAEHLLERIGCLLIGGRTFRGDDPNAGTEAEGAFGGQYHGPAVVLTRHPPADPPDGVEFLTDLRDAVDRASELAGAKYVNILGAETARGCLDAGLLDEVLLFIVPIMLGDGTRVLHRPGGPAVELERLPATTEHWYRVRR